MFSVHCSYIVSEWMPIEIGIVCHYPSSSLSFPFSLLFALVPLYPNRILYSAVDVIVFQPEVLLFVKYMAFNVQCAHTTRYTTFWSSPIPHTFTTIIINLPGALKNKKSERDGKIEQKKSIVILFLCVVVVNVCRV